MLAFAAGSQTATRQRFAVAVYGGAFDPPHAGHLSVIQRALTLAERVLVVPSYRHADGKRMVDFPLRCAWMRRLAARFGDRVECCEVERTLGEHGAVVYSYDLLSHLARQLRLPTRAMALVIGEDNQARLAGFHRGAELREAFGLLVAREEMTVHSREIRAMIATGQALPPAWQLPETEPELMVYRSAM
ncbi:nicotinate-nicotinamide nucleotide adenylyltransferase [Pseudomonas dryadis]|uniref:nicotinate-nucleotide adenylyltransferase n=2 Tax=Pseudomonadales TaxID=72274 RepID=A0A4Q9R907_9GAMM|nr:nicotinate-nicotinamide nucleotide adenylyltransferase [Pseudomonas dryadis]TBV08492.1 nicotinate-nicotinamide nucleotide adenylyltransferase [Pseudomonas dryadis]TBV18861.1 nicotinate-nicotinamide nucleotide adenylyltransferase [Pseudomonas sp. FRB 230]